MFRYILSVCKEHQYDMKISLHQHFSNVVSCFRRQSECAEAEHGGDGAGRPARAEDKAEILHQGGEQTNQIVSNVFTLVTGNNCF